MSGVKYVSKQEGASAGGGSFAQQDGLIARHKQPFILVLPPAVQLVPICHQGGSAKITGGTNKQICVKKKLY